MYIQKIVTKGVGFKVGLKYLNKPIMKIDYASNKDLVVHFEDNSVLKSEKVVNSEWNEDLLLIETSKKYWYFINK